MSITTLERALPCTPVRVVGGPATAQSPFRDERVHCALRPVPLEEPSAVIIPLRRLTPAPAERPLRLTRRGRLALSLAALACVLTVAGVAYSSGGETSAASTRSRSSPATAVVRPGDTLWQIARQADPQADPRVTVDRIIELNGLAGAPLRPGQRLLLPAG